MLQSPLSQSAAVFTAATCVWSWVRGRWPERVGAVVIGANWAGSIVSQDPRWYHHGQPVNFALDGAMFAILLGLVLCTRRTWVLWSAAFCLLLVLTHVVMMLDVRLYQWSFWTALYIWGLGVTAALGVGAAVEGRRPAPLSAAVRGVLAIPSARARRRS